MSIDSTGPPESQSILPFQRVPERLFTSVRTIRLIGVPEFFRNKHLKIVSAKLAFELPELNVSMVSRVRLTCNNIGLKI